LTTISPYKARRIEEALRQHSRMINGFVVYDYGWSDVQIAERLGISRYIVEKHRRKAFGRVRSKNDTDRLAKVEELYKAGFSRKEIAAVVGISRNAVGGITFRHRKRRPKLPNVSLWKGFQ